MAEPFHLVGLPWGEAEQRLGARGLRYATVVTVPPGRPPEGGVLRVVGVRDPGGGAPLLVILAHARPGAGSHR